MKTCTDTPRASSRPSIPHTPVSERTPVSACPSRHVRFARHRFHSPPFPGACLFPLATHTYLYIRTTIARRPAALTTRTTLTACSPGHQRLRLVRNRAGAGPTSDTSRNVQPTRACPLPPQRTSAPRRPGNSPSRNVQPPCPAPGDSRRRQRIDSLFCTFVPLRNPCGTSRRTNNA